MSTIVSGRSSRQSESLKKRDHITYDKSWNLRLSHLMGVYSRYYDSYQQYKALALFNAAISLIQEDKQNRIFYNKQSETLDYDAMVEFDELAQEFKRLFGTVQVNRKEQEQQILELEKEIKKLEKRLDREWNGEAFSEYKNLQDAFAELQRLYKFNLMELRAVNMPEPSNDKVYIGRELYAILAWGDRPAAYLAFRIGFSYDVMSPKVTPSGMIFSLPEKVPMLDWSDPNIVNYRTNCVPYAYWIRERTQLLNVIMPLVFKLETIIAQFLHNEGVYDFTARKRQGVNTDQEWTEQQPVDESDKYNT